MIFTSQAPTNTHNTGNTVDTVDPLDTADPLDTVDPVAGRLILRVLSALLREDVAGLRSRGVAQERADGTWLRIVEDQRSLALPVEPDGFQAEVRARLPLLESTIFEESVVIEGLDAILAELAMWADPVDWTGFAAYATECRQAVATMNLHEATHDEVQARLLQRHGPDPASWTGMRHTIAFDALAARIDHPVYPTARARSGLEEADLRAYAPEFAPELRLAWLALPADAVTLSPDTPSSDTLSTGALSPGAGDGFPRDNGRILLPVHPLSAGPALDAALREAGLAGAAQFVEGPDLTVVPTLSMRTLARLDRPIEHLKVPLATATLGLRNRRTIKPGTLLDGATGQRLVAAVLDQSPALRDRVLCADETRYAHANHELLAALIRRYPVGLEDSLVVPLAALLAPAPDGRLILQHTADAVTAGDPLDLLRALWELLFDLQVTLFTHGIALESHQQNLSLIATPGRPLRLLLKDNDGPRVLHGAAQRLGLPDLTFDDARTWVDDPRPLADMVATITVHLCAGSYAFGLAEAGLAEADTVLDILRDCLDSALDRAGTTYLRQRLLEDPSLPVKAMVTAGTLLSKERSGATDINKHYTTGPNYLRPRPGRTPGSPR